MSFLSTLPPTDVAIAMVEHGVVKAQTRLDKVFFKAVLAGMFLSTGGLLLELVEGGSTGLNTSNPGLVKILGGAVFPVGLVMIVLTGAELLTSNMMVLPMAWFKRAIPWWSILLNWLVVFFGNLVGSLFFAAVLVKFTGIISTAPYDTFVQDLAIKKAGTPNWLQIFLRGIGCNWMVSIAVWMAAGAKETISKIVAIWIPIWIFVAVGYDHVVANMFLVPLGILFGADLTVAEYIRKSLLAAFFGNIVGAMFVAIPHTYFYLHAYDYERDSASDARHMRAVEEGETINEMHASAAAVDKDAHRGGSSSGDSLTKRD